MGAKRKAIERDDRAPRLVGDGGKNKRFKTSQQTPDDFCKTRHPSRGADTVKPIVEIDPTKILVTETEGDIFDAHSSAVVVHACNCQGSWGAGIAKAFRKNYPKAYPIYADHCTKHGSSLLGTALLIPSQAARYPAIGCLFTSRGKGRTKDTPSTILDATRTSMEDLLMQIDACNKKSKSDDFYARSGRESKHVENSYAKEISEFRICKINSGLFAVPWEDTKKILEAIDMPAGLHEIKVISRPE